MIGCLFSMIKIHVQSQKLAAYLMLNLEPLPLRREEDLEASVVII